MNLEVLVFMVGEGAGGGTVELGEPSEHGENQQQTQPTYCAGQESNPSSH